MSRLKAFGALMMAVAIAAGAGIAWGQSRTQDVEVAVAARSVQSGRIELAIAYDGERVLPSRRYMTAQQINAQNDSWLLSTPVTIQAPVDAPARTWDANPAETQTTTATALERATYLTESTETGEATLDGGEFRAPVAPGSSAELVIRLGKWAAGGLDGRGGEDAAAIIIEEPGGSGTFYFVHALTAGEDGLRDAGVALLGDRIRVQGVSIHDGVITVALLDRAPDQGMSLEPTVAVIRRFALEGGALVELDAASE